MTVKKTRKIITIEDARNIALKKNGICLSETYKNNSTKMKWKCENGHEWEATYGNVSYGKWCKKCAIRLNAEKKRNSIDDAKKLAELKGGQCISTVYISNDSNLLWKCGNGHEWEATYSSIRTGSWCRVCRGSILRTIEDAKAIAKKNSGECLSEVFINTQEKLKWRCAEGHEWETTFSSVNGGTWCRICSTKKAAKSKKNSLEDAINLAEKRNGECLSKTYENAHTLMKWKCNNGHIWEATYNTISGGRWCKKCAIDQLRTTITDAIELAKEKKGHCLSTSIENVYSLLKWRCSEGHEWETRYINVKSGTWCRKCATKRNSLANKKYTIQDAINLAKVRNGECLTDTFVNSQKKLKWKCSEGHEFEQNFSNVKLGKWCKHCNGVITITIDDAKALAKQKNGDCLSNEYINVKSNLKWRCAEGHEWETNYANVKSGSWCKICDGLILTHVQLTELAEEKNGKCLTIGVSNKTLKIKWECSNGHTFLRSVNEVKDGNWCPNCSKNIYLNEEKCKFILEELTGKPFIKTRKILSSGLELDCYNEELSIALEYQGEQHTLNIPFFHRSVDSLKKRLETDEQKREECKELGIYLIEVSYEMLLDEKKADYIKSELKLANVMICKAVQWETFYSTNFQMERIKQLANERDGECLSTSYINNQTEVPWRCEKGHVWQATPNAIQQGSWCPTCGAESARLKRKASEDVLHELAKKQNGKYVGGTYQASRDKVEWECEQGHRFELPITGVQQGSWCTKCSGTSRRTIKDLQNKAVERGGKCLSKTYYGNRDIYLFECGKGHIWEATANKIMSGSWCHYCGKNKRLTIDKMKEIAKFYGGICESEVYINNVTPLVFRCKDNHKFELNYNHQIKRGYWCPSCPKPQQTLPGELLTANHQAEKEKQKLLSKWKVKNKKEYEQKDLKRPNTEKEKNIQLIKEILESYKINGRVRYTTDTLQEVAAVQNGICLSKEYLGVEEKMTWKCQHDHMWEATISNIRKGKWCPYCSGSIVTIEMLKKDAASRNGKILDEEYKGARFKYTWECEEGHQWKAISSAVRKGAWCPKCNGTTGRVSLQSAIDIAKKRNGECLSTEYLNVNTQMLWRCEKGHEWNGTYNNICRGKWCPYCSGKKKLINE